MFTKYRINNPSIVILRVENVLRVVSVTGTCQYRTIEVLSDYRISGKPMKFDTNPLNQIVRFSN